MELPNNFVIRVYGLIVNGNNEILLSDEFQMGMKMTKFLGGGLQFGEGPIETLRREFKEECNGQELKNIIHFYTTDFYQKALFFESHQLLSIYYLADLAAPIKFTISKKAFDFEQMKNGNQSFRWVKISLLSEDDLTFPIDKIVAKQLISDFSI